MSETMKELGNPLLSDSSTDGSSSRSLDTDDANIIADSLDDAEIEELKTTILVFGKPYFAQNFLCVSLPLSLLSGLLVGVTCLCLLGAYYVGFFTLHPTRSIGSIGNVGFMEGEWIWMLTSIGGAVLIGLISLLPSAPKFGSNRNMFIDLVELKIDLQPPFQTLSGLICLCAGFSVGAESILATSSAYLASLLSHLLNLSPRTSAAVLQCCLGAAFGLVVTTPVLCVLLILELSVTARPGAVSLDAVVSRSSAVPIDSDDEKLHDLMEQCTLVGTASIVSHVIMQFAKSYVLEESDSTESIVTEFSTWYYVAAIPIGIGCGLTGLLFLAFMGIGKQLRKRVFSISTSRNAPLWFPVLVTCVLAGGFHGIIVKAFPMCLGSDVFQMKELLMDGFNETSEPGILIGDQIVTPIQLLSTAFFRLLTAGICLGLGIVGGPICPQIHSTILLAFAVSSIIPCLPSTLTVPCAMAATMTAFVPTPTFNVFMVCLLLLDFEIIGPVLVATFSSFAVCGGSGIISHVMKTQLLNVCDKNKDFRYNASGEQA